MAHTYTHLVVHALFSTAERRATLDAELRPRLFSYMAGIVKKLKGQPLLINGPSDHVHMLFVLPPVLSLADMMEKVKANSSKWVNEGRRGRTRFSWQTGYTAFSVSQSQVEKVGAYIANQEKHHQRRSYLDEVKALLEKHGIGSDE